MACLKSKPQNIVQGVYDIYVNQPPVPLIRKKNAISYIANSICL